MPVSCTSSDLSHISHSAIHKAKELRAIAELVIPDWKELPTLQELEIRFPQRILPENAIVSRVGPSPTGYMHIGGLYISLINYLLAKKSDRVFILRVEDTDQVRYMEQAVSTIVDALPSFSFNADEGLTRLTDKTISEIGNYGPYVQSKRLSIYKAVLFELLCRGHAYPCFLTSADLEEIRHLQSINNTRPGIYGSYARSRSLTLEEISSRISKGDPYTIRLRVPKEASNKSVSWMDMIRGSLALPANETDIVLMKSTGMASYHFAHLVDDHFMRTTHVIRADEWISSMPIHLQLFEIMGWTPPLYGHVAPIQKMEGASRRKLSKRKDPEADLRHYLEQGYPPEAIIEYLLTLANADFELWRKNNPSSSWHNYPLDLSRLNNSGALADFAKLRNISRAVYARLEIAELSRRVLTWAKEYPSTFGNLLLRSPAYTEKVLMIERLEGNGAKRLGSFCDLSSIIGGFFDELLPAVESLPFPAQVSKEDRDLILNEIAKDFHEGIEPKAIFDFIKGIACKLGFAPSVKEYRNQPDNFKGHVGDVAMVIRVALFGDTKSPDLGLVLTTLGAEKVKTRCQRILNSDY